MKKLLFSGLLLLVSFAAQAQETGWQLLKEADGVRVEYLLQEDKSISSQMYVLRVQNTNTHDVAVSWDYRLGYSNGQESYAPTTSENHVGLTLKAGESLMGSVPKTDNGLTLHHSFTGKREELVPTHLESVTLEQFKVFTL